MAFLLMRLITIFVLAFMALSAMAVDDFDATFSFVNTVRGTAIDVTLTFGETIALADVRAATINIVVTDVNGRISSVVALTGAAAVSGISAVAEAGSPQDGKTFSFTIPGALTSVTDPKSKSIQLFIAAGVPTAAPNDAKTSKKGESTINLMDPIAVNTSRPGVVLIQRLPIGAFQEAEVTGPFDVWIVLTEKPHDFKLSHINVDGGTASNLVVGAPFTSAPAGVQGPVPPPTGPDNMYHQYRVTITPHQRVNMVKVSIKEFHDGASPYPNVYKPLDVANKPNGREQLGLAVATDIPAVDTESTFHSPREESTENEEGTQLTNANNTPDEASAGMRPFTDAVKMKAAAVGKSVSIPEVGRIYISEIMFAEGGMLPQWIEISNGSQAEQVNLSGWTLTVDNAAADTDVSVGAKAVFTIPEGIRIDPSGQNDTPSTVLVVTEQGRTNLTGRMASGQIVNLWTDQQRELIRLDIFERRYSLLSDIAFKITLTPPVTDMITEQTAAMKCKDATDSVGNLADDGTVMWALPMNEDGARSSIIRRHVSAEPKDGKMMDSWVLALDTGFAQSGPLSARSYYGLPIDVATPGFRSGGALPVELSHFHPTRDKATGAVVITWTTQSELNNAGFFIRRSQQREGQFQVINATLISGAGTTSEKQFYTYTDTTAQPNVVYYYQIEDVSLDGNRQTLTRGIRLKGHIGAAGKLTSTWGELKTSNE